MMTMDSNSMGDSSRHLAFAQVEAGFRALQASPRDQGKVALILRKRDGGVREVLEKVMVSPDEGVPGDAWGRRAERKPDMQISVMQKDVSEMIANGQDLALAGDNLVVDLDLSTENLPAGTRILIGTAHFVVTPQPHTGCKKYRARFGDDALRFISQAELRPKNLRGIYIRVTEAGEIRIGDRVEVLSRPEKI